MLVNEDVVEAAGELGLPDPRDLAHGVGIGKPGNVEDDRPQVGVRAALAELEGLNHVVAAVELEVLDVHSPGALVQVLVLNAPAVDDLRILGVLQVDDVRALGAQLAVDHARDVRVGAVHLLLELDVRHAQLGTQGRMPEHIDVVAARLHRRPLAGCGGDRQRECQNGGAGLWDGRTDSSRSHGKLLRQGANRLPGPART